MLACVDGSNDGLQAVGYATAVASCRNVDLCIVHVAPENGNLGIPLPPVVTETLLGVGNTIAEAGRDYAVSRGFPSDRLSRRVCLGHRSRTLNELSAGASAIVLGRRNLADWSAGSGSRSSLSGVRGSIRLVTADRNSLDHRGH